MYKVWWNNIIKANKLVNNILLVISNENNVVLSATGGLPWGNHLVDIIEENIRSGGVRQFEVIACPDEDVGEYLLNNYCKKEKRNSYRIGKSYAAFLAESDGIVLNSCVIWVKNINEKKANEWMKFIDEYRSYLPKEVPPALFILEVNSKSRITPRKRTECISFNESISYYDRYAFCTLLGTELLLDRDLAQYLAELVSSICIDDVELCAACMNRGQEFLKNPEKCILDIIETECRDDGSPFVFELNGQKITSLIWESQLKTIFPVLERYRSKFVNIHKKQIANQLPIKNEFGEDIDVPEDAELGLLYYLISTGRILAKDNSEMGVLGKMKDARNSLAHLTPLSVEDVKYVLTNAKK